MIDLQKNTQQSKFVFFFVLFLGFVSGAAGGGIAGYIAAGSRHVEETIIRPISSEPTRTVIEESGTSTVVQNTKSSVVSIVISKKEAVQPQVSAGNSFFDYFFGRQSQPDANVNTGEETTVNVCSGTGFVISEDGLILTNRHVICEEDAIYTVNFDDGKSYDATVVARDQLTDLAILRIDAKGLKPLVLGDSDSAQQGQTVIAIGNTLGEYANTVTKGIVSGLSRDIGGNYTGLIQTDAAISQGNSGGPLLNLEGEVIGINTAVDRSGEGIGFAIPINEAKVAIESTKQFGRIVRPALGIRYIAVDSDYAKSHSLPFEYGAYIPPADSTGAGVIKGGSADVAGLKEGDIILQVDGVTLDKNQSLPKIIKGHAVGDTIILRVYSDGAEKDVEVKLAELPEKTE